jgi:uncharacterized protein (DUF362 family)
MNRERRAFLKQSATAAVGMTVGGALPPRAKAAQSRVYVAKGDAHKAIDRLCEALGGIDTFVKKGHTVLIKPNMSFANPPKEATGTSPDVLRAVIGQCLDAGARRIIVCDNTLNEATLCKKNTGLGDVVAQFKQAEFLIPSQKRFFVSRQNTQARHLTSIRMVRQVEEADCFISLPVAKSHSAAGVSLNMKGLMGLIEDRHALHSRMDLHKAIPELLLYMKPDLCIVDAQRALLDNGPGGPGKVATLDTFVAGVDPVAVDSVTVELTQWYGKSFAGTDVSHVAYAEKRGLGNAAKSAIERVSV